jgi:hypothetical protein
MVLVLPLRLLLPMALRLPRLLLPMLALRLPPPRRSSKF